MSSVRRPQSAVHSPSFMLPDLKRSTMRNVMLQGYNKSLTTSEKTFSSFLGRRLSHDTGRLWIAVGVTFPLEKARRRHGTLLHYKATAILFAVAPLPVLPSPPVTDIFGLLAIFVFHKYKNQKAIFILDFISFNTVSRIFIPLEYLCLV